MATYYVDTAVGNDGNAGTSEGAGNAWATIDHAMNTISDTTNGDKVWVKASGTYSEDVTIDTTGGSNNQFVFEGYTSTTGDGGKVTISGTTNCLTTALTSNTRYCFKNFIFTGSSGNCVNLGGADYFVFYNCEFNNSGAAGAVVDTFCKFINCEFTGNTGIGVQADSNAWFFGCISANNGGVQYDMIVNSTSFFYRCVAYGGASGVYNIKGTNGAVVGCTIDGETNAHGISLQSTGAGVCVDNIIYDCNIGLDMDDDGGNATTGKASVFFESNNLFNSNTTDYNSDNFANQSIAQVTGAPAFTDEAGDDYTLGGSSPAIDAGVQPGGVT